MNPNGVTLTCVRCALVARRSYAPGGLQPNGAPGGLSFRLAAISADGRSAPSRSALSLPGVRLACWVQGWTNPARAVTPTGQDAARDTGEACMAIIGGYASPASLYLEGSAMTMIQPDRDNTDHTLACGLKDVAEGRVARRDDLLLDSYAWPEPKHRADVEPETAVTQCCGQVVCCPTCNEPVGA